MYKTNGAAEFRQQFNLPDDYRVDGLLAVSTWDLNAEARHLPYLREILEALDVETRVEKIDRTFLGHCYEFTVPDGRDTSKRYWYAPVMGTAVMSQYVHIGSVLGSKKNIILGTAGGLAPMMRTGDLIAPNAVHGNDNAAAYDRTNLDRIFRPDPELYSSLLWRTSQLANITGTTVWDVKTTTCEMVLAETADDVRLWQLDGYGGVEMETGLVFAASTNLGVPAAGVHMVLDELANNKTFMDSDFFNPEDNARRDTARQIQYAACVSELLDLELPLPE
ncbi:MAG TPA: hypothetical protein VLG11_03025 [Candidatus Saccharimonadales bacterium]|nr:hypothetical protein [Candidatus Saccharimonadales bacterium]